jgi:peptidoglycan L-alanyl-D-glutamate endopeptidase CwlK
LKLKRLSSLLFLCFLAVSVILYIQYHKPTTTVKKKQTPVPLPTELNPVVKERSNELIQNAAKKGIQVVITDDFRSVKDQDELYQQGRTVSGHIVTNAKGGNSYHNYGLAIDFALQTSSGNVIWDMDYDGNGNGKSDWNEVVAIAKDLGFKWGGDWKDFQDYPHLQMDFGLSLAELKNGERPTKSSLTAQN